MAEPIATRNYNFSDGTLLQEADNIRNNADMDVADLAAYGVTAATITAFLAKRTAFLAVDSDEYMLSLVIAYTQSKNNLRKALENKIRLIRTAVEGKFKPTDPEAVGLGIKALASLTDNDFKIAAFKVHQNADKYVDEYLNTGIDAAFVADLLVQAEAFDLAMQNQSLAIGSRDDKTQERIQKGNLLYTELVRLASFGKDFYDDTNEAKYNNYVIYETSNAIGNIREDDLNTGLKANPDFPEIQGNHVFNFIGDPVNPYQTGFSATTTGEPATLITIAAGTSLNNATALSLGWAELSPYMIIKNASGATVHYKVVKV